MIYFLFPISTHIPEYNYVPTMMKCVCVCVCVREKERERENIETEDAGTILFCKSY